jgi:sulfite exporter TauE/SafE
VSGASFMVGFGAGTSPVLAVAGMSLEAIRARMSPRLRRLTPVALVLVAIVLAARGFASAVHVH